MRGPTRLHIDSVTVNRWTTLAFAPFLAVVASPSSTTPETSIESRTRLAVTSHAKPDEAQAVWRF